MKITLKKRTKKGKKSNQVRMQGELTVSVYGR
jgi:hypothetical protein